MNRILHLFIFFAALSSSLFADCVWEGSEQNYRVRFTVQLDDEKNPLPNYGIGFYQVADGKVKDLNITFFFVKTDSIWVYEYPANPADIRRVTLNANKAELVISSDKDPTKSQITFSADRGEGNQDCRIEIQMQMPSFGPSQPAVKMVYKSVKEIILPQLPLKQL